MPVYDAQGNLTTANPILQGNVKLPKKKTMRILTIAPKADIKELLKKGTVVGKNIVIEEYPPETETEGGLARPEAYIDNDRLCIAWIYRIGDGCTRGLKVGQSVVFLPHEASVIDEFKSVFKTDTVFHLISEDDLTIHEPVETTKES